MSPYVDAPTIPEGMTCAEYRTRRRELAPPRGAWARVACRLLAVTLYHSGFIGARERER